MKRDIKMALRISQSFRYITKTNIFIKYYIISKYFVVIDMYLVSAEVGQTNQIFSVADKNAHRMQPKSQVRGWEEESYCVARKYIVLSEVKKSMYNCLILQFFFIFFILVQDKIQLDFFHLA